MLTFSHSCVSYLNFLLYRSSSRKYGQGSVPYTLDHSTVFFILREMNYFYNIMSVEMDLVLCPLLDPTISTSLVGLLLRSPQKLSYVAVVFYIKTFRDQWIL